MHVGNNIIICEKVSLLSWKEEGISSHKYARKMIRTCHEVSILETMGAQKPYTFCCERCLAVTYMHCETDVELIVCLSLLKDQEVVKVHYLVKGLLCMDTLLA